MKKEIQTPGGAATALAAILAAAGITPDQEARNNQAWSSIDVDVERHGRKIVLPNDPAPMSYAAARKALERREEAENEVYDVMEFIPGGYWDAGLAFYKAMQRTYGFVTTKGLPSFWGRQKPDMVTIRTGPGPKDVVQMPMGEFTLPSIENPIFASPYMKDGVPGFRVAGSVKQIEQAFLIELCNMAREILRLESIYRGQAIRLFMQDDGTLNFNREPEFLNLDGVSETDLIFNTDTARLVETNIFTPMRKTTVCRSHRIPLKRAILMEGPYGCGKSLTSRVAAKVAADHDWTFIALDRVQGLRQAIEFARLYQPAVIFAEDIDRIGDRAKETTNDLINMLDGVLTKDVEIMVVLTTNHIEKIDQAFLRPGRFDAVIRIDAPDAEAVEKLFRFYGRGIIAEDANLQMAAEQLAGNVPAVIREVVERAKLSMILDEGEVIEEGHLRAAAVGMKRHLELLAPKGNATTPAEQLATSLRSVLGAAAANGHDKELDKSIQEVLRLTTEIDKVGRVNYEQIDKTFKAAAAASVHAEKAQTVSAKTLSAVNDLAGN